MPIPNKLKTKEDALNFMKHVSEFRKWKLNPDEEFIDILANGLMVNYNRYGYFSCPCRAASGIKEKDKDITCPCDYCVPDQEEFGHCYCGLYLTPEYAATGEEPESIPDRHEW
ncbi:MAG: ferredoxin-thioredoxin reductase catalytic domain-containing protein [Candidatus Hodarchaeota archaeon]